jgi:DnaJ-class molecular chaperone
MQFKQQNLDLNKQIYNMNTRNFFKGNNSDKLKLYSKLEVNVKASEEEIKKNYFRLAK